MPEPTTQAPKPKRMDLCRMLLHFGSELMIRIPSGPPVVGERAHRPSYHYRGFGVLPRPPRPLSVALPRARFGHTLRPYFWTRDP